MFDKDLFGETAQARHASVLAQTFDYPPFSVLNAREGWWQERKRQWLALGIQSELGRGGPAGGGNTCSSNRAMQLAGGFGERHGACGGQMRAASMPPHAGKGIATGLIALRAEQKASRQHSLKTSSITDMSEARSD